MDKVNTPLKEALEFARLAVRHTEERDSPDLAAQAFCCAIASINVAVAELRVERASRSGDFFLALVASFIGASVGFVIYGGMR